MPRLQILSNPSCTTLRNASHIKTMKFLPNKFLKMSLLQSYEMILLQILGSATHTNHKKYPRDKSYEMPLLQIEWNASPTNPTESVLYKSYEKRSLQILRNTSPEKSYEIPILQILRHAIATILRNDTYTDLTKCLSCKSHDTHQQ